MSSTFARLLPTPSRCASCPKRLNAVVSSPRTSRTVPVADRRSLSLLHSPLAAVHDVITKNLAPLGILVAVDLLEMTPPALAVELPEAMSRGSYYVTLGLFVMTVPGLWSLIKRSTKSKIRRRTYSVPGPAEKGAMSLDDRAQQIARYFLNYNYQVKSMSDIISFVGNYQSSVGQASQLVLYTFFGLGSIALVLSVQFPKIGNWWYLLTAISPLAGWYYWKQANRKEEIQIKLEISEDEKTTDIVAMGDEEELDRFGKELDLQEKGKVYVKGIMDR